MSHFDRLSQLLRQIARTHADRDVVIVQPHLARMDHSGPSDRITLDMTFLAVRKVDGRWTAEILSRPVKAALIAFLGAT